LQVKAEEQFQRWELQLLKFFSVASIVHMAIFGLFSYTVDSEIWSVNLAQYVGRPEFHQYSVYNKPLFYLLLKLIYHLPLGNLETLILAKTIFIFNGLLLTYLCFIVFRRLLRSNEMAWVGLFFLMLNPTWITECFRIRADFLAMLFSLLGLSLALKEPRCSELRRTVLTLLCLVGAFLCTPKAIIWNLPIFTFLVLSEHIRFEKRHRTLFFGLLLCGAGIFALVFRISVPFQEGLRIAWRHFVESQADLPAKDWVSFSLNWILVFNSILAAPVLWSLVLVPVALQPWMKNEGWSKRKSFGFSLMPMLLLVMFFFFSAKTTFLWAAMLPVLILPGVLAINKVFLKIPVQARVSVAVLSFLIFAHQLVGIDQHQNGISTYRFIQDLDRLTNGKKVRIFDSMGLLPRTNSTPLYIGFADSEGNASTKFQMRNSPPDIVLNSSRIQTFAPELLADLWMTGLYTEIQKGLWVKEETFGNQAREVSNVHDLQNLFNQRVLWRPN
jgi:hypothetical protein